MDGGSFNSRGSSTCLLWRRCGRPGSSCHSQCRPRRPPSIVSRIHAVVRQRLSSRTTTGWLMGLTTPRASMWLPSKILYGSFNDIYACILRRPPACATATSLRNELDHRSTFSIGPGGTWNLNRGRMSSTASTPGPAAIGTPLPAHIDACSYARRVFALTAKWSCRP